MSTVSNGPTSGQPTDPPTPSVRVHPAIIEEMDDALRRVGDIIDGLSHMAVRDDGALMVSLEDANLRDLTGREVIAFVVLTPKEARRARERASDALGEIAARAVAELPKVTRQ